MVGCSNPPSIFLSFHSFFMLPRGSPMRKYLRIDSYRLMLIGGFTGFLSALLGVGGGFILIPLLIVYSGYKMTSVAKVSLLVTFSIAFMGALTNFILNEFLIDLDIVAFVIIGALPGSWLGSKLAHSLDHKSLVRLFSILLFFMGVKMLGLLSLSLPLSVPASGMSFAILGFFSGMLSGLFGIGGGVILVPSLTIFFGLGIHAAIATSLASIIPIVLFSLFFHRKGNWPGSADLKRIVPAAVLGAATGALVSTNLQPGLLEALFGVILIVYSGRLFVHAPDEEKTT
ncbi:MAG: sulfite exporter TauE/SafE family protein [Candidatus Micrarchaeota archaeon]